MKVRSCSGHSRACGSPWLPAGGPQPAARDGVPAQQPPNLIGRWPYATAAGAAGEQAGRGHCTPGEIP